MVTSSVTGSTARGSIPARRRRASGRRADAPDRALVLGRVDELGALRRLAAQRPAQLAHQALAGGGRVEVDALADQRRAAAVLAAAARLGARRCAQQRC